MMSARDDAPDVSDGELARRIMECGGSAQRAEGELCRRFAPRIRLYGCRHLGSEEAADDLVQNVLALVLTKLRAGEVREPDRIASFALGTARTLTRVRHRSADARTLPLENEPTSPPVHLDPLASDRLLQALDMLSERARTVIVSTYFGGYDAAEIASQLGIEPGNVRVIRHRAIARLRRAFESHEEEVS